MFCISVIFFVQLSISVAKLQTLCVCKLLLIHILKLLIIDYECKGKTMLCCPFALIYFFIFENYILWEFPDNGCGSVCKCLCSGFTHD